MKKKAMPTAAAVTKKQVKPMPKKKVVPTKIKK